MEAYKLIEFKKSTSFRNTQCVSWRYFLERTDTMHQSLIEAVLQKVR